MVLQDNNGDSDNASGCSAELSNTDSGRGASEDGEHHSNSQQQQHGIRGSTPSPNQQQHSQPTNNTEGMHVHIIYLLHK